MYNYRPWVPEVLNQFADGIIKSVDFSDSSALAHEIYLRAEENRVIHDAQCINLDPAANIMNPRAEALLASGLGSRPSLGYPGDKYEMGLEAIEQIEVLCAALATEIFSSEFAEIRVGSGALANLYAFMATCQPGDRVIVPPASIGGHVTHHTAGAAGWFGLEIVEAEPDASRYSVDLDALRERARECSPRLITIGGSLNRLPHPVAQIREIADEVGAYLLVDAAHQCGMIASGCWPNPLQQGAHLMTMSTYKSLGGPPSGLIVSNDAALMERIDSIAFPGLTANFDAGKAAALAISLLDWREYGEAYGRAMVETAAALSREVEAIGAEVFKVEAEDGQQVSSRSHQFALRAAEFGGGQTLAGKLRDVNILSCGIGLPLETVRGDMNGLRLGSPEIVRIGMQSADMPELAACIHDCLYDRRPVLEIAQEVSAMRGRFDTLHYIRD